MTALHDHPSGHMPPPTIGHPAPSRSLLVTGPDGFVGSAEWLKGADGWRISRCTPALDWMRSVELTEIKARLEREGLVWRWL